MQGLAQIEWLTIWTDSAGEHGCSLVKGSQIDNWRILLQLKEQILAAPSIWLLHPPPSRTIRYGRAVIQISLGV